jgi:transposase
VSSDPRDLRIAELEALLAQALARIAQLERENAELKARLNQNSRNSSKPPSSDGPQVKRPPAGPSQRKRGGQPGHEGARRERLPADEIIDHRPTHCERCARPLSGSDPDAKWFQILELPEVKPVVTEHRAHALTCEACGAVTAGVWPDEVLLHGFGPRLSALVAYLTGRCHLSKRQVVELCEEAFDTPMSLGAVCALEQDVSAALAAPVEEARAAVRKQDVANMDETGWSEEKRRAWLWVAVTSVATVFCISRSRGSEVAQEMLGKSFEGRVGSDRWSGYNWLDPSRRQVCWAHLLRDLQGMVDRGGLGGALGGHMLTEAEKMFEWWAQVRDGTLDRREFQRRMQPVRQAIERDLGNAEIFAEEKTAGMCREILKLRAALWTFVDVPGLEPTNNVAERALRPPVLWRKGSFGTDSPAGSRFVERILTAVATVRQRGGRVLEYLASACASYRASRTAPSLLAINSAQ